MRLDDAEGMSSGELANHIADLSHDTEPQPQLAASSGAYFASLAKKRRVASAPTLASAVDGHLPETNKSKAIEAREDEIEDAANDPSLRRVLDDAAQRAQNVKSDAERGRKARLGLGGTGVGEGTLQTIVFGANGVCGFCRANVKGADDGNCAQRRHLSRYCKSHSGRLAYDKSLEKLPAKVLASELCAMLAAAGTKTIEATLQNADKAQREIAVSHARKSTALAFSLVMTGTSTNVCDNYSYKCHLAELGMPAPSRRSVNRLLTLLHGFISPLRFIDIDWAQDGGVVNITTDATTFAGTSMQGVTAHYIDSKFRVQSTFVGVIPSAGCSTTSAGILQLVRHEINEHLPAKVLLFVTRRTTPTTHSWSAAWSAVVVARTGWVAPVTSSA